MSELPSLPPFNDLAVDLLLYANSAVQALHAGEVMAARGGWSEGFKHSLEELRKAAEASGAVCAFFRWAGETPEREHNIRILLSDFAEIEGFLTRATVRGGQAA